MASVLDTSIPLCLLLPIPDVLYTQYAKYASVGMTNEGARRVDGN
jgi:hypothetical protein